MDEQRGFRGFVYICFDQQSKTPSLASQATTADGSTFNHQVAAGKGQISGSGPSTAERHGHTTQRTSLFLIMEKTGCEPVRVGTNFEVFVCDAGRACTQLRNPGPRLSGFLNV